MLSNGSGLILWTAVPMAVVIGLVVFALWRARSTKRPAQPRPTVVKAALAIMLAALAADAIRSAAWAVPATAPQAAQAHVASTVVSSTIGAAIVLAVALRQRWAAIVYTVLVSIGASFLLVITVRGVSAARSLLDLTVVVAEITAACLLLTRPASEWFAGGRSDPRFPPLWHPDPTGRHQFRYWNGRVWTAHVSDNGAQSLDPLPPIASA